MTRDDELDRREDIRREDDRVTTLRIDRLEKDIAQISSTVDSLGSAFGHLALVDSRVDENRRRIEVTEKAVARIESALGAVQVALEGVRVRVLVGAGIGSLLGAGLVAVLVKASGA